MRGPSIAVLQSIEISMALSREASIGILDEPTSAIGGERSVPFRHVDENAGSAEVLKPSGKARSE